MVEGQTEIADEFNRTWNLEEVTDWLTRHGLSQYTSLVAGNKLDGADLLELLEMSSEGLGSELGLAGDGVPDMQALRDALAAFPGGNDDAAAQKVKAEKYGASRV
jgi:hypothetical protein